MPSDAVPADRQAKEWFRFLGEINRYSALEPAGSRGSIGVGAGAGAVSGQPPTGGHGELFRAQMQGEGGAASEGRYMLPRLWIVKGLPWPVDFGVMGGSATDGSFTQAGGHVQWTAYEELGMPALTVRAGASRLFGMSATEMSSTGIEGVASWGFLRYFTVYGAVGVARHSGRLVIEPETPIGFLLAGRSEAETFTRTWHEPVRAAGLKVMAWPPYLSATIEAKWDGGEARAYAAKLSFGM